MTTPLLVTADPLLREELMRLAAAAGVVPEHARDPGAALAGWRSASAVLVGTDLVAAVAALAPPRRPLVFVVSFGEVADGHLRAALEVAAESVVELPGAERALVELLSDLLDPGAGPGRSIGVVGGSGGAGASVLACALVLTAAGSAPAMVLDLDPWGPGQGRIAGLAAAGEVGWESLARNPGRLGARSLREALPRSAGAGVLSWCERPSPVSDQTAREALAAGLRGHAVVVLDLPRDRGLIDWVPRLDLVIVVVRADLAGLASAGRLLSTVPSGRLGLVVRGPHSSTIAVQEVMGRQVLARMVDQRGLTESVDLGLGPVRSRRGPLARAASEVLWHLSAAPAEALR